MTTEKKPYYDKHPQRGKATKEAIATIPEYECELVGDAALNDATKKLDVLAEHEKDCNLCQGIKDWGKPAQLSSSKADTEKCVVCNGQGYIVQQEWVDADCDFCKGTGKLATSEAKGIGVQSISKDSSPIENNEPSMSVNSEGPSICSCGRGRIKNTVEIDYNHWSRTEGYKSSWGCCDMCAKETEDVRDRVNADALQAHAAAMQPRATVIPKEYNNTPATEEANIGKEKVLAEVLDIGVEHSSTEQTGVYLETPFPSMAKSEEATDSEQEEDEVCSLIAQKLGHVCGSVNIAKAEKEARELLHAHVQKEVYEDRKRWLNSGMMKHREQQAVEKAMGELRHVIENDCTLLKDTDIVEYIDARWPKVVALQERR